MIRTGVKQIRQNLTEYLKRVQRGEEVIITRHDEPIAKLVPFSEREARPLRSREGLRRRIAARGAPLSQIVAEMREERV